MSESGGTEGKITSELIDELQRSGRTVFLRIAGYIPKDIAGFGDLVKLPEEKMQELLRNRTELEIAYLLGEAMEKHPPRIKKLHGKKRKKSM
jgi:hypothetical protein